MARTEDAVGLEVMSFRISPEEKEALEALARREDRSAASVIRLALREYIARHEQPLQKKRRK